MMRKKREDLENFELLEIQDAESIFYGKTLNHQTMRTKDRLQKKIDMKCYICDKDATFSQIETENWG